LIVVLLLVLALVAPALATEPAVVQEGFRNFRTKSGYAKISDSTLEITQMSFAEASTGSLLWENYEMSFKVTPLELGSQYAGFSVFFRSLGGHHCYSLNVTPTGVSLNRYHGVYTDRTVLASYTSGIQLGETAEVTLKAEGNEFAVFLNGRKIISAKDPLNMYPYGHITLRAELARLRFEDWKVEAFEIQDPELRRRAELGYGLPVEVADGQMHPVQEGENEPENIVLIYEQASGKNWITVDALPYVTYISESYQPLDWFFDTFLFLGLSAPGGRNFQGSPYAVRSDYEWWLDRLFANDKSGLWAFERAVGNNKYLLGDPDYKANVIIMIPYPNENPNTPFGEINGVQPVLSGNVQAAAKGRLSVVEWYINEVLDRWEKAGFENLRLIGLYWNAESIDTTGIDRRYLPEVGKMVREHGLKFYWIPWYKAPGYSQWKDLGFDAVMLQPNYMFDHDISRTRLITAASEARKYGLGMEIEADSTVFTPEGRERYLDYLRAANSYGYASGVLKAFYQETSLLANAALSSFPQDRELYDITYDFLKGNFTEKLPIID